MKNGIIKSIIIVGAISVFFACKPEPLPNISSSTTQNVSSTTTPNNPSTTTIASLIITENNDSVFVADSAYWEYIGPNNAILKAYANGDRRLELYVGDPHLSKEWIIDPQGMAVYYFIDQISYGTSYAQTIFVNSVQGNLISGNFNHQMIGNYYQVLADGTPNYVFVNEKNVRVEFENIPQKP